MLLHRRTRNKKWYEIVVKGGVAPERIMQLLLNTAQLEYKLKQMFKIIKLK